MMKNFKNNYTNFITVPKDFIYDTDMSDRRVLLFAYLTCRKTADNASFFCIEEFCSWLGLKPNFRENKINTKIVNDLNYLRENGYFDDTEKFPDITPYKATSYHKIYLNPRKFDVSQAFGTVYFDDIDKIINFKEWLKHMKISTNGVSAARIILVLAYIRFNIFHKSNYPMCCYRYYNTIASDIGIPEQCVGRIVEILEYLRFIKCAEIPCSRFQSDDGNWKFHTGFKVFADYKRYSNGKEVANYNCDAEIEKQIKILKGLINRKRDESRHISGEINNSGKVYDAATYNGGQNMYTDNALNRVISTMREESKRGGDGYRNDKFNEPDEV